MTKNNTRREVLKAGGIVSLSAVTGTTVVTAKSENDENSDNNNGSILGGDLIVINHSSKAQTFYINIHRGESENGKSVFEREVEVEPGTNPDSESDGKEIFEDLSIKAGRYRVEVEIDSDETKSKVIHLSDPDSRNKEQLSVRKKPDSVIIGLTQV